MYRCESWNTGRLGAKELVLSNCGDGEDSRVPWKTRRSNQSILKEINPEYSLKGLILKLKLQYFGHLMETAREFQKNIYFCFIDYAKAFDCVDHNKLWKILKEMGIPDHLTCLLRNLYAGQEATVRTGHGTTGWFQIGKGIRQGCILSP